MKTGHQLPEFNSQPDIFTSRPPGQHCKPNQYQRNNVGNGFRGPAKILATMTGISFLLKSGPVLVAGLAGCLIFIRSCIPVSQLLSPQQGSPTVASSHHTVQQPSFVQSVPFEASARPTRLRQPQTTFATPNASAIAGEFDLTPLVVVDDEDGLLSDNTATSRFIEPIAIRAGSRMPPFENGGMGMNHSMGLFGGLFNQSGHGSMDPSSSFMERTIANPIRAGAPSDQFSFKRGRKFTGTSQQSGQPSMRVQLSIISVKDRGTSVTARLSSLDSSRLSRNFNGLIETDPLRLTLIPEAQSNGFSTFVTYQPWHSNSPTRISLEINSEKGLSGTSGSNERFELFAEPEPQPSQTATRNFNGFNTDANRDTEWRIRRKNGNEVSGESWLFSSETMSFVWKRDGKTISKGNYKESIPGKSLDLIIVNPTSTKLYPCLYIDEPGNIRSVRVCIPRVAGATRPAAIDSEVGNLFDIESIAKGAKP